MAGVVEKFNSDKRSKLSTKRDLERGQKRGRTVPIRELTLNTVRQDAINFSLATDVLYQIGAGKEASIYLALWREHPIILKAYRFWQTSQTSKRKGFFAPGEMEALAAKEFDILSRAFKAGVSVPTPIGRVGNYLTMRFIGDGHLAAPQLKNVVLDSPEEVIDDILDQCFTLYCKAHYVHGDFGEYNLLWWNTCSWIIDLPQAYYVGPWANMDQVRKLLKRDIRNILAAFKKYGVKRDLDAITAIFLEAYTPENLSTYDEAEYCQGLRRT